MNRTTGIAVGLVALVAIAGIAMMTQQTGSTTAPVTSATNATTPPDEHVHTEGDGHDHSEHEGQPHPETETTAPATNTATGNAATGNTTSGNVTTLQKTDIKPGTGTTANTGDRVTVHYVGTLTDGTKFDASTDRGEPFEFTLGAGNVIEGWDKGVVGMKEGGKRKLVIPGDMAYGPNPPPGAPIPPNATLVFEVELLKVG